MGYSGVGIFNWYWYDISSPPQVLWCSMVPLERRGLMYRRAL
jgi:hypothetical protein